MALQTFSAANNSCIIVDTRTLCLARICEPKTLGSIFRHLLEEMPGRARNNVHCPICADEARTEAVPRRDPGVDKQLFHTDTAICGVP